MNIAPTVQLSTISAPAPEASPAPAAPPEPNGAAPPAPKESGGASGAGETPKPDPNLEASQRLGEISKKEARIRRLETEHHERIVAAKKKEEELAAKEAELDAALGDPVKYMLDKGKDPVAVAKRFSQPETEEEKRIRKLEERDAAREKEAADAKAAEETQRKEAARQEVVRTFVSEINEDNCPNVVALYKPTEIHGLVRDLLNRPYVDEETGKETGETLLQAFQAVHGRPPTNAEIRESLEAEAQSRATKIIERDRAAAARALESQAGGTGQSQASGKTERGPSGISNTHASVTSSGKSRKGSLAERRAAAKRELTEALEAEASDRE